MKPEDWSVVTHTAIMCYLMWILLSSWNYHSVCHKLLDFPFLFCMVFADRACYKYNICKNSTAETIPHFKSACQTRISDFFTFICNWSITLSLINPVVLSLWGQKQQNVFLQTWIFQKSLLKTMLHWYLVTIQRDVHIYIFIYRLADRAKNSKTTLKWRWSNDPAGMISRICQEGKGDLSSSTRTMV